MRTAATPSATGRCSTRCSTSPAARRGCRCTTAAAWHGLFAAQRRGDRVRRHEGRGQAHRARAVERPGHRRDAPCGCGLRDRAKQWRRKQGLKLPMV
jgi:hypothetical protein